MKVLLLIIVAASALTAQDAKTAASKDVNTSTTVPTSPSPIAQELTEPASDSLNRSLAEMMLLEEQFHIKEFQAKVKAIRDHYEARVLAECAAVGIVAKTFADLKGRCEANPEASKDYPRGVLMWVPEKKEKP